MTETDGPAPATDLSPFRPADGTTNDASTNRLTNLSNNPLGQSTDNGLAKRPRDTRLIHIILANLGVTAYQERVPLQLMDFAYRYTSSTLQDALHLTTEGYGGSAHPPAAAAAAATTAAGAAAAGRGAPSAPHNDMSAISLSSLRLSVASRTHYQFNPNLPKEFYNDIAQKRNRVALPLVEREWGLRLPPEQYCLTGEGWNLKDEWDAEDEEMNEGGSADQTHLEDVPERAEDSEGEDEDENGRMEDIFGEEYLDPEKDDEDMGG